MHPKTEKHGIIQLAQILSDARGHYTNKSEQNTKYKNMFRKQKTVSEQEALQKLAALCARAEHSSGEMIDRMRRWQLPDDARQRVLDRLIDGKYVDDERYSRMFAHDKIAFDRWGRRKIEMALYKKGVTRNVYATVLDEIPDSDYVAALRPLLAAKRKAITAGNDYEAGAKLIKFALSRGFGMEIIRQCISSADEYDISDDDS